MQQQESFVIAVSGADSSGLLSQITAAIDAVGGNLGDSRMYRLAGMFSAIIEASTPPSITKEALSSALDGARAMGLRVEVRTQDETEQSDSTPDSSSTYIVSSSGADRPGIILSLTRALTQAGCEFSEVTTHITDGSYIAVCEIDVPDKLGPSGLEDLCESVGSECDTDFIVLPADLDELTA